MNNTSKPYPASSRFPGSEWKYNFILFFCFWGIIFLLYLPAATAGRVGDFPGWVKFLNSVSFIDYINRKGSSIASMYQITQMVSWLFYQLFGVNAWLWHLLYVTLQALNALLLFRFFNRLFTDSSISNGGIVAFGGTVMFCCCPHISEVVVWEPSFHYLLGLLFILIVLLYAQKFINTQKSQYAWWAGIVFLLSSFSLEVFYLTPIFVSTLVAYYGFALARDKHIIRMSLSRFLAPQAVIFLFHLTLLISMYHRGLAHVGSVPIQFGVTNLSLLPKYLFHLLFFGRFFPAAIRQGVYHFSASIPGLLIVYGLLGIGIVYMIARYRKMQINGKALVLLALWVLFSIALIMPLTFPETGLVIYDRYTYVTDAFIYVFLCMILNAFCSRNVFIVLASIYVLLNLRFTHRVNAYWQQSAHIVDNLLNTFPNDPTKKVLLLAMPECLDGVQMIGTRDDGEFSIMYNAIMPHKLTNTVYDVEAFYLQSPTDGAHISVINDSVANITLNQWGTWWLYYGLGAGSYENDNFRVNMRDEGHWYELTLKHPADQYLLLFEVGDQWKKVDWAKKTIDQY